MIKRLATVFITLSIAALFTGCDGTGKAWNGDYNTKDHGNSLSDLSGYTSINGNLTIQSTGLIDLEGLGSLAAVSGNLAISDNDSLENLYGLNNLKSVGGGLTIVNNNALRSLGFDSLFSVGNDLSRDSNHFNINSNLELCNYHAEDLRDQVLNGAGIGGEITIQDNRDCSKQ